MERDQQLDTVIRLKKGRALVNWFGDLKPALQVALIAASVAVVSTAINIWATRRSLRFQERLAQEREDRQKQESRGETYQRYAEPLTLAAVSLYWRLREVFEVAGGGAFLAEGGGATRFEMYKVRSTQYRLAALLGWFTALERELLLVGSPVDPTAAKLHDAVDRVEDALASGGHVQAARARILSDVMHLGLEPEDREAVESHVDAALSDLSMTEVFPPQRSFAPMTGLPSPSCSSRRSRIVSTGNSWLTYHAAEDLAKSLATHEAWLYRDWQDAIGDLMLEEANSGVRRYDVASYRRFEDDLRSSGERWIAHLDELTSHLDVDGDPLVDARIDQLRSVHLAVARLILDFDHEKPMIASKATLEAAQQTLATIAFDVA